MAGRHNAANALAVWAAARRDGLPAGDVGQAADLRFHDLDLDGRGNYTLGIREQIIFPEVNYDKVERVRGMNVSIVTTAKTDEEGRVLLSELGMPFRQ